MTSKVFMTVPSACMDLELCETTTRYLRPVRTDEAKIESANYINMQRDGTSPGTSFHFLELNFEAIYQKSPSTRYCFGHCESIRPTSASMPLFLSSQINSFCHFSFFVQGFAEAESAQSAEHFSFVVQHKPSIFHFTPHTKSSES